eukprot:TRINITY_DN3951_c0_g1_i1.p1 TRINITY_DN3951_c0_g1~~TRINITY_DN3951_c0_g1_i1.p1  ORF type:complete len:658 (-),score=115.08 TRINITY_DN3951_c0_g1_i1:71-2044(-)
MYKEDLAGGFRHGDPVLCKGLRARVVGRPSRPACARFSVSVCFEDGRLSDERVANLVLDEPAEDNLAMQAEDGIGEHNVYHGHDEEPIGKEVDAGYGGGHRMLQNRHARKPVGGEVEAGYGIGNRMLDNRQAERPVGGEVEAGYGIGDRILDDRQAERPMGGEVEAGYGVGNRMLDDRHVKQPLGGEVEAGYGVGNRMLDDRHVKQPLGGEVEAGYGVGNRMLDDRHVKQPLGGEVEAGYGVGTRMLDDRHAEAPVGGEEEAGYGLGDRILDDRHARQAVGGEVDAGYGVGNRMLDGRHSDRPLGGEIEAGYGLGNRVLHHVPLAGGLHVGDLLYCGRDPVVVAGPPARAACADISVAVRYEEGHVIDRRLTSLSTQPSDAHHGRSNDSYSLGHRTRRDQVALKPMGGDIAENWDAGNPLHQSFDAGPKLKPSSVCWEHNRPSAADRAETVFRSKLQRNFADLRCAYRALDRSNNGYLTRSDFLEAMRDIFLAHGFSDQDVNEVAERFDLFKDAFLSYAEFVAIVEAGEDKARRPKSREGSPTPRGNSLSPRGVAVDEVDRVIQQFRVAVDRRYSSSAAAFRSISGSRGSGLDLPALAAGFQVLNIFVEPNVVNAVFNHFDVDRTGRIALAAFCKVMQSRQQYGDHLGRQTFKTNMI